MAGLFARLLKTWVEDAAVSRLAESPHMQRAAVTVVGAAQEAQRLAEVAAKDPAAAATHVTTGAAALWAALQKEIAKDFPAKKVELPRSGGKGEELK